LGPIHLNLSKKTAVIISFISILITGISLIWMFLSVGPSSSFMDYLSGFAPGLGAIIFIVIFLYTLLKEGIYPLKEKIIAFLNFDQAGVLIK
jgi:cytosine/uracil/thiamine/allantoin permease